MNLNYTQFDIKTAFLYGKLQEQVYISVPEGLTVPEGKALLLNKGLYGLKQAPRVWSDTLNQKLEQFGFKKLYSDSCIYYHKERQLYLCIYVDDGLIFANKSEDLNDAVDYLRANFDIRILKDCTFVGLQIERSNLGIFIHQASYATRIIERFKMTDATTNSIPLPENHNLTTKEPTDSDADCPYREAIGSLMYLATNSRPDILHTVTLLAKFQAQPLLKHWQAVKNLLRYMKATVNYGLLYEAGGAIIINAYTDADFASD